MKVETIQTGWTLVLSSVPDRSKHRWKKAYSRLFQSKNSRIKVPVKCFYVTVDGHKCKGRVWIFLYKYKRLTGLLVSFLLCFDFWRLERSYHLSYRL